MLLSESASFETSVKALFARYVLCYVVLPYSEQFKQLKWLSCIHVSVNAAAAAAADADAVCVMFVPCVQ